MLRLIVCMIGLFLFGVLYAEIFNGFDWIGFKLNPYIFGTIVAAVFLVSEIVLKRFEERARRSNQDRVRCEKIRQIVYVGLSILGFILLVMVPFIWWGAIKKLAESANKGIY
jgi:hypothetical protein